MHTVIIWQNIKINMAPNTLVQGTVLEQSRGNRKQMQGREYLLVNIDLKKNVLS